MFLPLHFAIPSALFLVLVFPFLFALLFYSWRKRMQSLRIFFPKESPFSLTKKHWIISSLLFVSWLFTILALMQPEGNPRYLHEQKQERTEQQETEEVFAIAQEVIFLIDTSRSMSVKDTRKRISRLEQAKEIAEAIIGKLQGEYVAVYAFTSELIPVVPITLDTLFSRLLLRTISIDMEQTTGTDFSSLFETLKKRWETGPTDLLRTLIIFSDGDDTRLLFQTPREKKKIEKEIVSSLGAIESKPIKIITIGIGSKEGGEVPNITYEGKPVISRLEESLLQRIAEKGKGEYLSAANETAIGIATEVETALQEQLKEAEEKPGQAIALAIQQNPLVWTPYFQIPLLLAIFFLFWAIRQKFASKQTQKEGFQ